MFNDILQKFRLQNIINEVDLGTDASCFCIFQCAVNIDQDLIGLIQFFHHDVYVIYQDGETAHDQKAGDGDAHSRKGHESVGKNALDAFFQQITDIIDSHSDNHPFRR